jgi:beta-glucuronidase
MLYPKTTPTRYILDLNGIWHFSREQGKQSYCNGFVPEKLVPVPGSLNDLFTDEELRTWDSGMWYSKKFFVPKSLQGNRLHIRFGSATYRAEVFLNGKLLGGHESGYTPFEFEISSEVGFDEENLLCVRLDHTLNSETIPMGNLQNEPEPGQHAGQYPDMPYDFFPYSGLHRPIYIYSTPSSAYLDSLHITTKLQNSAADVRVTGTLVGRASKIKLSIVETGDQVDLPFTGEEFDAQLTIQNVLLWDVGNPNLYHLRVQLLDSKGDLLDDYTEHFGVRTVRIEGSRLLLNDRPVYLQGFGRHEDFPVLGRGLSHNVNIRDFELLKWINANSLRTAHYPHAEEMIRLADTMGVLLIGEAPAVSINFDYATEKTLENHLGALKELVMRDINSPSVIMWSVANEATTDREESVPYFKATAELVRSLDTSRPITMVTCKGTDDKVMEFFDIVSVNLYPGWYYLPGQIEAARRDIRAILDAMYAKFRKPIFLTEFGADAIAGLHRNPAEQWSEEYQADLVMGLIEEIRQCAYMIGEHVWSFADFRTGQSFIRVGGNWGLHPRSPPEDGCASTS